MFVIAKSNQSENGAVSKRLALLGDLLAAKCKINFIKEEHEFVFCISYYIMESKAMFCER